MNADEVRYCPRCGTPIIVAESFGRQRPQCPACGWIYFADPKVAVAVFLEQDSRVLLVRRTNEPFRGLWTLPAGFVDAGENPAQAAERECLEETGLTIRALRVRDVIAGHEHQRGADFVIVYDGQMLSGQLTAGDDADRAEWFDRAHLPPLAFDSTRSILTVT